MKFAVIKGAKDKKFFKRPAIIENGELNYVTLELPYTLEELRTIKEHKLQKAMEKSIAQLQKIGINRAIFTLSLKEILSPNIRLNDFRVVNGRAMFFDFVPKMVDWIIAMNELEPPNIRISVREEKLSGVSQSLIEKLCYKSKYILLNTADIMSAKRYADFLFEQFGFILDISTIVDDMADIVIDIDKHIVSEPKSGKKIDGIVVDGIEIKDTDIFDCLAVLGVRAKDVLVCKWTSEDKYIDIIE